MAAIDALLGLIDLQKADGLWLAMDQPPALLFGSSQRVLTMPALDAGIFLVLFEEITNPDQRSQIDTLGTLEFPFDAGSKGQFKVLARRHGSSITLRVRKGGSQGTKTSSAPTIRSIPVDPPLEAPPSSATHGYGPGGGSSILDLLRLALERSASDVYLCSDRVPFIRTAGDISPLRDDPVGADEILAFFLPHLPPDRRNQLESTGSVDLAYQANAEEMQGSQPRRFRVNLFRHIGGLSAAIRPIWDMVPSLDKLNLPDRILALTNLTSGLVLMTGLSGSGKSTTLATLLDHINQTQAKHIVTLEDPIEYLYRWKRSVVHQREVGAHVISFASGLRAALRENPDIILVGEMRDPETIALALTAAETGHLVFSTLHSSGPVTAIDRIVDGFPESQQQQVRAQVANVLRTVITQRLVAGRSPGKRFPALEILNVTYAVASQIREGKTHLVSNAIQAGGDNGMWSLDRALAEMVRKGAITEMVAIATARDPEVMKITLNRV